MSLILAGIGLFWVVNQVDEFISSVRAKVRNYVNEYHQAQVMKEQVKRRQQYEVSREQRRLEYADIRAKYGLM
jgi:cell shape-determining protein MreC